MREKQAPALAMPKEYQVPLDLLCLSILVSPLGQDFARAMLFIALLAGWAAQCLDLPAHIPMLPFRSLWRWGRRQAQHRFGHC